MCSLEFIFFFKLFSSCQAIQLDPANESYKGNLDALQEQLKASNSPQGGGANPGMGAAGLSGKFLCGAIFVCS